MAEDSFHHFAFSVVERRQSACTQVLTKRNRRGAENDHVILFHMDLQSAVFLLNLFTWNLCRREIQALKSPRSGNVLVAFLRNPQLLEFQEIWPKNSSRDVLYTCECLAAEEEGRANGLPLPGLTSGSTVLIITKWNNKNTFTLQFNLEHEDTLNELTELFDVHWVKKKSTVYFTFLKVSVKFVYWNFTCRFAHHIDPLSVTTSRHLQIH